VELEGACLVGMSSSEQDPTLGIGEARQDRMPHIN